MKGSVAERFALLPLLQFLASDSCINGTGSSQAGLLLIKDALERLARVVGPLRVAGDPLPWIVLYESYDHRARVETIVEA